jgi:hypothetical protein
MTADLVDAETAVYRDMTDREREVFEGLKAQAAEDVDPETIACLARIQCKLQDVDERERRAYAAGYVDALNGIKTEFVSHASSSAVPHEPATSRHPKRKAKS